MEKIILYSVLFFISLITAFVLFPSPIDAVYWEPGPIPALIGKYQKNEKLNSLQRIYEDLCFECEDVAVDSLGRIFGGSSAGDIVKIENGIRSIVVNTGGRPLGLDFASDDNLIVADAIKGLLEVNMSGHVTVLSNNYEGEPFIFVDDIEVGSDGIYYFSDASSKFGYGHDISDLLEHGGHGRLFSYDPKTRITTQLLDGLQFANGIAVASDASFVFVNETGLYSVRKYWLNGPQKGTSELIIDDLPGYPDGISRGSDGTYWLTLVAPRDQDVEDMMTKPWLRNLILKLPKSISDPVPKPYAVILGIDENGNVKYNYQSSKPKLTMITSVQQFGNEIYFGTLRDKAFGKMTIQ